MKSICKTIASLGLLGLAATGIDTAGIDMAAAMPSAAPPAGSTTAAPRPEAVRLVCNYRRCYRVGGYHYYYRPYGYYRPYYYRPHIGIGIGGFGVGVY